MRVRARSLVAAILSPLIVAGVVPATAFAAPPRPFTPAPAAVVPSVAVNPVPARRSAAGAAMADATHKPAPVWPAAGVAVVDLPSTGSAAPTVGSAVAVVRAGTLPVSVGAAGAVAGVPASAVGSVPGRVRVEVLDRAATGRAGVRGLLLRLGRLTVWPLTPR